MQQQKEFVRSKGGRPKKPVKRNQSLTVKCTIIERKAIERKAKESSFTVSEYLRNIGLAGKIDRREKLIPKEILEYKGTLNHMAANLNQLAKKMNNNEALNEHDWKGLYELGKVVKQHVENAEKYFQ